MSESTFWVAFWPDLAATLLGAAVGAAAGIPAGLWLNRRVLKHQEELERATAAERLRVALDELSVAVALNLELLRTTHKALASGRFLIGFPANVSTWEVVRGDVLEGLRSTVGLRVRLARFFEELALFANHLDREASFALTASAEGRALGEAHAALAEALPPFAERLIGDLERLQADLKGVRASVAVAPKIPTPR